MADGGDEDRTPVYSGDASNEEEITALPSEQERLAQQVKEEVQVELSSHIAKLEQEMKDAFSQRMTAIADQCTHQTTETRSTQQVSNSDIRRRNNSITCSL
jgi:hypothetical protein